MAPNWVTINLGESFFPILQSGFLNVKINPQGGTDVDHIWIDFAELRIETGPAPAPEPSTILLLGSTLIGLVGFRKRFRK